MVERWRDMKGQPGFVFHAWMRTVDDLEDQIESLIEALKWFSNSGNWREEELSDGIYVSAEWKLGFDPREIARRAIAKAIEAEAQL